MTIEHDELDKEWDSRSHTPDEYRREIRELRDRCVRYAKELTELREELVREQRAHLAALEKDQLAAPLPKPPVAVAWELRWHTSDCELLLATTHPKLASAWRSAGHAAVPLYRMEKST
jgi:hypothetical protein